jgi:hypothetical protein
MTVGDALFGDDGTGGIDRWSGPDALVPIAAVPPPRAVAPPAELGDRAAPVPGPDADAVPSPPPVAVAWVPPQLPTRPRVVDDEPAILGLTRRSHGRIGTYVFRLFFAAVYAAIVLNLIVVLLGG